MGAKSGIKVSVAFESLSPKRPPPMVRGVPSWPWWLHFTRDSLGCLAAAQARLGPLCVLGNPLPLWTGGRRFVIAVGGDYARQVLGQPDVFRPGGQVMLGPRGSAHHRIRRGIFAMYGHQHRTHRRAMQPPLLKPAVAGYTAAMARLIDQIIDRWRPGETLDIYREMRALSNWVAAYILFGNDDGWVFQIVNALCPSAEDLLHVKEFVNKRGSTLRASIGRLILPSEISRFPDNAAATAFLRDETEKLARSV